MIDDPSPRRRPAPSRLWTDPREEDEHTPWLSPRTAARAPDRTSPPPPVGEPQQPPPAPSGDQRLWPLVAIGTLIAIVLFAIGVLGAKLLRDDPTPPGSAALPAAPGAVAPDARSRAVRDIYASASPSVVSVSVRDGGARGSGTGFVIDSGGIVVTNAHVVDGADRVQVRFDDRGAQVDAQVLGSDQSSDLAVLRVDADRTANVEPLALADSDTVSVGDLAVAIGYPLGLDRTVTAGIVSGVGRAIQAPNGFSIDKVIQTDAPINPGNSGGPLLDAAGRVIGVNSQIATTSGGGGNVGIGFAVPSNTVREVVPRLRSGGAISRAYLGISSRPSTVGQGATVAAVVPGGPAASGGLRVDDTITRIDGKRVVVPEDISAAIAGRRPGDEVDVQVRRAGASIPLRVRLGTRPEVAPGARRGGP